MDPTDSTREHQVREIREDDLPAFQAARPDAASMGPYLLRQKAHGIGTGLVARIGDELAGSLELCWTWPPEVRNVHVVEARRGQGVGTALLAAAEQAVWRRAAESSSGDTDELAVQLWVGLENPAARRLYERLGYRLTGERASTTYSYVDDDGSTGTATETEERLIKRLQT